MTSFKITPALTYTVILLAAIGYNSYSFAHPPDEFGIPKQYRRDDVPKTDSVIADPTEAKQVKTDEQQDVEKLSKECKILMKKECSQSEYDGVSDVKENDMTASKKTNAKLKACKAALKNITTGQR